MPKMPCDGRSTCSWCKCDFGFWFRFVCVPYGCKRENARTVVPGRYGLATYYGYVQPKEFR